MGPLFALDGVEGQIGTIGQSGQSKSSHSILLERTSKDNGLLTPNDTIKEYTKFFGKNSFGRCLFWRTGVLVGKVSLILSLIAPKSTHNIISHQ